MIKFNQCEYRYIVYWLENLQYAKKDNAGPNEYLGLKQARRILTAVLEQAIDFTSLDDEFTRELINDVEIASLAQRFKKTLEFNQITSPHYYEHFIHSLNEIAEDRKTPILHSMIIYQCILETEWDTTRQLYLIDQLTGQAWLAFDDEISTAWTENPRRVLPALCHATNTKLREHELALANDLPNEVITLARSQKPEKLTLKHSEIECECEIECKGGCFASCDGQSCDSCACQCNCNCDLEDVWTPLVLLRNMNVIPLVHVNKIDLNVLEVFYLSGLPGVAQWGSWEPLSLLQEIDNDMMDLYDIENANYESNYKIILTSGLAASMIAKNGLPNLVNCNTLFTAQIFSNSHTELLLKLTRTFSNTIDTFYPDEALHNFCSILVENITDDDEIVHKIPALNLQQDLLGLLNKATDIQLVDIQKPVNDINSFGDNDLIISYFLIRANVDGKNTIWRCPEETKINSYPFLSSLNEKIQSLSAHEIASLLYGLNNTGFDIHGKFCFGDPFSFEYKEGHMGRLFLVRNNQYLSANEIFDFSLDFPWILRTVMEKRGIKIPNLKRFPSDIIQNNMEKKNSLMGIRLELSRAIDEAVLKLEKHHHLVDELRSYLASTMEELDTQMVERELNTHLTTEDGAWVGSEREEPSQGFSELLELSMVLEFDEISTE